MFTGEEEEEEGCLIHLRLLELLPPRPTNIIIFYIVVVNNFAKYSDGPNFLEEWNNTYLLLCMYVI